MQLSVISLVSPQLDPSVIPKLPRATPFLPGVQTSQVALVSSFSRRTATERSPKRAIKRLVHTSLVCNPKRSNR